MNLINNNFLLALILGFNAPTLIAEEIKILKIYKNKIVLYSEDREQTQIVESSAIDIHDPNNRVQEFDKEEGLVKIEYGKDTEHTKAG